MRAHFNNFTKDEQAVILQIMSDSSNLDLAAQFPKLHTLTLTEIANILCDVNDEFPDIEVLLAVGRMRMKHLDIREKIHEIISAADESKDWVWQLLDTPEVSFASYKLSHQCLLFTGIAAHGDFDDEKALTALRSLAKHINWELVPLKAAVEYAHDAWEAFGVYMENQEETGTKIRHWWHLAALELGRQLDQT